MLAKAGLLKTEALEMAMRDQDKISGASDIAGLQMSAYRRQRRIQNADRDPQTRKDHENKTPARTRVEFAVATSMVELNQMTGHGCALRGVRHTKHVANKIT